MSIVVDGQNHVEQRRVQLGQSTPSTAVIMAGLNEGDMVVRRGHPARPAGHPGGARPRRAASRPRRRRRGSSRMISAVFVDRPRLAIVIAILMTLAGVLSLLRIPVAQFPDIVPPQVTVSTSYRRRLGRRGRGDRRAAAGGADRRRRQDDLHEVDQRQRRQLHADRQLRAGHQSRHRHRQRQQPRAAGAVASCRPRCSATA